MIKYETTNEKETFEVGLKIGEMLSPGSVVAFYGDLGVGKTMLAKGIAKYFNIDDVYSPTFTLVNEYNGDINIYHFDGYRITSDDWLNSGFDEYLFSDGICIIEWSENLDDILPEDSLRVKITKDYEKDENYREIEIFVKGDIV